MGNRFLNVSLMQLEISEDVEKNLQNIKKAVDNLMLGYIRPELIIGVEYGISRGTPISMDDKAIEFLSNIAKENKIYFIPGTMAEKSSELTEGNCYNTCPVFGPDGNLIDVYRKKVPFKPGEKSTPSGDDHYCIFEIKEKNIKAGLMICYDQFFPEIARTLALKGAEIIICPSFDPMEYQHIPDILPRARALENELYFIWTNGAGQLGASTCCGKSTIVDPEGQIVFQCSHIPTLITKTLDFRNVTLKRLYGRDQHLNSLREFNVKYPYANNVSQAPIFKDLERLTYDKEEYKKRASEIGMGVLNKEEK